MQLLSPAGISLVLLSFAAAVSSQPRGLLQRCWQTSVLAPASGARCAESDLKCICGSLNNNLNSLLDCIRDPNQISRLPAHNVRQAIDSRLVSCSSSSNQNSLALAHHNQGSAANAVNDQTTVNELRARSTPEKEDEVEGDILIKRVSTVVVAQLASPTTTSQSLVTSTVTPTTSVLLDNGMGTETLIPTYTDTPPLIISVPATGTSSPTSKPTRSSGNNGGTLLDMSGAASTSAKGKKSLLGLTVFVLACVAFF